MMNFSWRITFCAQKPNHTMIFSTRRKQIDITSLVVGVVVTATGPNPITFIIFFVFNICICWLMLLLLLSVCMCVCVQFFAIWNSDTICSQHSIHNIWHQSTGLMNICQHITQRDIRHSLLRILLHHLHR